MAKFIYLLDFLFFHLAHPMSKTLFFVNSVRLLESELEKIGVLFYYLNDPNANKFEYEYFGEDVLSKLDQDDATKHASVLYTSARSIRHLDNDNDNVSGIDAQFIALQHEIKKADSVDQVNVIDKINEVLKRIFPRRTRGIETKHDAIKIYLQQFPTQDDVPIEHSKTMYFITVTMPHSDIARFVEQTNLLLRNHNFGFITSYPMVVKQNVPFNIEISINTLLRQQFETSYQEWCSENSISAELNAIEDEDDEY